MNYQEKVSTRQDVRELFLKVKANPAVSQYRGYTETKSYGWDEGAGDYVKCDGEVWFKNPSYAADFDDVNEPAQDDAALEEAEVVGEDATEAPCAECEAKQREQEMLAAALEAARGELALTVAKKDALCAILCNLRAVLEAVLAHKPE